MTPVVRNSLLLEIGSPKDLGEVIKRAAVTKEKCTCGFEADLSPSHFKRDCVIMVEQKNALAGSGIWK